MRPAVVVEVAIAEHTEALEGELKGCPIRQPPTTVLTDP